MALCSVTIAAGVLGVVALVKLLFGGRFGHHAFAGGRCGAGFGGHACGGEGEPRGWGRRGWGSFGGHRGGIGRSLWLRALYARLDTTPGQEREIRAALEELRERARDAKTDLPGTRQHIGKALAGDDFDASAFEAVSARFDATAEKMKDALASALRRVHAVLDPRQRERLAELIRSGSFGRFGGSGRWGGRSRASAYRD